VAYDFNRFVFTLIQKFHADFAATGNTLGEVKQRMREALDCIYVACVRTDCHSPSQAWLTCGRRLADAFRLELALKSEYYSPMPLTLEQLTAEAMQLPVELRVLLADRLVESLDSAEPDDIQRLWAAEAIRRRDEVRSGRVKSIPGEQVLEDVRRLVGR
jgi:hypothetical protein